MLCTPGRFDAFLSLLRDVIFLLGAGHSLSTAPSHLTRSLLPMPAGTAIHEDHVVTIQSVDSHASLRLRMPYFSRPNILRLRHAYMRAFYPDYRLSPPPSQRAHCIYTDFPVPEDVGPPLGRSGRIHEERTAVRADGIGRRPPPRQMLPTAQSLDARKVLASCRAARAPS